MKGNVRAYRTVGLFELLAIVAMLAILVAPRAMATAATAEVDTPSRDGITVALTQGSNVIYAGTMVVLASGKAEHATDAASKTVVGRAEVTQDNTGSSYSSTRTIRVRRGIFRWANGGSFTDSNIGDLAYVEDNKTVTTAAAASQDVVAGIIIDVDDDGVWVDSYAIGGQGAAALTTLTTTGAASLGSTLAVAGNATFSGTTTTVTNNLAVSKAATIGTTLTVTGAQTNSTIAASGNVTVGGTLTVTGAQTNTAAVTHTAQPRFNATSGTPGTVTLGVATAPAGTTTNAHWLSVSVNGTNCWVAAYPQ